MALIKGKFVSPNSLSNAKFNQMAAHTYKGNNTGSTANAADITSTQLTADLNTFTSSLQGMSPASGGGTINFLRADGSWTQVNLAYTSQSATYNILTTDSFISLSSNTFTVTLPTASGVTGKVYTIKNVGTGVITIATTSSQTIDGTTTKKLSSQYESYQVISDGSNWQVISHQIPTITSTYTPTFTGIGTPTNIHAYWTRVGNLLKVWGSATTGTVTSSILSFSLPNSVVMDTTQYSNTKAYNVGTLVNTTTGSAIFPTAGAGPWPMVVDVNTSTSLVYASNSSSSNDFTKFAGNAPFANSQNFDFEFTIAINGWNE